MGKAKKILVMVAASVTVGAILGALYAPMEGSESRRKLKNLKRRFSCYPDEFLNTDKETLEELRDILQKQLKKINEQLEGTS